MDAIFSRRSIRKYTDAPVSERRVRTLLEAAMVAPSAGDQRPWHFVVIRDPDVLAKVPEVHPYGHMVPTAPVAILVCGDLQLEKHEGFWEQDCSAATMNLLLAAEHMGFGAVWLGVHPRAERVQGLRNLLSVPEHVVPFALVPIGRPAERKVPTHRYDESRIHTDRW